MTQSHCNFLPVDVHSFRSLPHGHTLNKCHIILYNDVGEEMDEADLRKLIEVIFLFHFIEFGVDGFFLYFIGSSFYFIDALPKFLLIYFQIVYFLL